MTFGAPEDVARIDLFTLENCSNSSSGNQAWFAGENPPVWIHLVRAFPRVSHDFPILSSCFRDFPAVLHAEGPRAPPCCRPVGALRPRLGHIERWPMCPSPARGHCVTGTEQMNVARATELGGFVDF